MSRILLGAVVALVLVAGCKNTNDENAVGRTSLTRAVTNTTPCANAIESIVARRCQAAELCAHRVNDAAFHADACQRDLRSHLQLDLSRSTSCPEDVDQKALNACLVAIDEDVCSRAMQSIDGVVACSHMELCGRAFPGPLQ